MVAQLEKLAQAAIDEFGRLDMWVNNAGGSAIQSPLIELDRAEWDSFVGGFRVDTYDVDFQHRFQLGGRQEIVWGLGYRYIRDNVHGSQVIEIDPSSDNQDLFSGFIQDESG